MSVWEIIMMIAVTTLAVLALSILAYGMREASRAAEHRRQMEREGRNG